MKLLPMLAVAGKPFDSDAYLFEIKWDGIRALAAGEGNQWTLWGTGTLAKVSSVSFISLRLAPSMARRTGMPSPSTNRLRLAPLLARSVGFLPVFFPPKGRFGHAPIHAQPTPVDALYTVILQEACAPHFIEDPLFDPLLKTVVSRRTRTKPGRIQGFPLATRSQNKENRIHADAVGCTRTPAAKAVRVHMLRQQPFDFCPEIVRDPPVVRDLRGTHP
jgi:hypothetical protein